MAAGLFSPSDDLPLFTASAAARFDVHNNFASIVTRLVEGSLGGGFVVAAACPDRNKAIGIERLIIFSTSAGLAWIRVATRPADTPELHRFLASIKVLHPGPKTGWFKPAPGTAKSDNQGFPICETDAAKATVGVAKDN